MARRLMLTTDIALGELALACRFAEQAYLCRTFRNLAGESPSSWRRARRQRIRESRPEAGHTKWQYRSQLAGSAKRTQLGAAPSVPVDNANVAAADSAVL
jgi:hypothetical protein